MALTDELRISLPFNNDWLDKSGNGNDVSPSGITFDGTNKKLGSHSAYGDGASDGEIANSDSLDISNITVATWIKFTTANVTIVYERSGDFYDIDDWDLLTNGGKLRCQINLNGVNKYIESSSTYNDGNWHLVIWSYEQTYIRLFIDNIYVGENAQTDPLGTSTDPLTLFARKGKIIPFPGNLDSFLMWGRALSFGGVSIGNPATEEIAEIWNDGTGIEIDGVAVISLARKGLYRGLNGGLGRGF